MHSSSEAAVNQKTCDELVLKFSRMMLSKYADSNVIAEILKDLCEHGGFDGGLIYEIDQNNDLHLKERHLQHAIDVNDCFPLSAIKPSYRRQLSEDLITAIRDRPDNTEAETQLLRLFSATSLVAVSLIDEHIRLNGLIVFFNASDALLPQDDELQRLSILLYTLKGYIGIRIYQNKLAFAQTALESILDHAGIDIYVVDFNSYDILYANKSMAEPYGGIASFLGNKCWEVLFPGQSGPCEFCPKSRLIDEEGNPTKVYSWDYQRPFDGSWFRVFSAAFRWFDGRLAHVVSSANITENKKNEAIIEYMANYDALTGLPNRRRLVNDCMVRINKANHGERGYLLFFDIDGFKSINDNFGHDAGDEFLIRLGEFFSAIPMLKDAIYRNGGDEFVAIVAGDAITETHIRSLVGFIHERFNHPWQLKYGPVFCNTSVGVACYPEDGTTAEVLLNKADQAMYQIKKSGGGGLCFVHEVYKNLV